AAEAFRRQQGVAVEPTRAQQVAGVRFAEPDQPLAVDPGEPQCQGAGSFAGEGESARPRWCSASATAEFESAFESARRYARPDASRMSVETPWPEAVTPPSSSSTVTSPRASGPPVTALTWYSFNRPSWPTAALIAL